MLTTKWPGSEGPGSEVTFRHGGTLFGEYVIIDAHVLDPSTDYLDSMRIRVPFEALEFIVAKAYRDRQIGRLENATPAKILGGDDKCP